MSSQFAFYDYSPAFVTINCLLCHWWLGAFHILNKRTRRSIPPTYVECRGNRPWERDVFIPTDDAGNGYWVAEATFVAWLCAYCLITRQSIPSFCYKQTEIKSYAKSTSTRPDSVAGAVGYNAPTSRIEGVPPPSFGVVPDLPVQFRYRWQPVFLTNPFPEPGPGPEVQPETHEEDAASQEGDVEDTEVHEEVGEIQDEEDDGPPFIETPETSPGDVITLSCGFSVSDFPRSYLENLGSPSRSFSSKRKAGWAEDDTQGGQPVRKRQRA